MDHSSGFDEYIERLNQIRTLSSPSLDGIKNADTYSRRLRENFVKIGRLAAENRPFLEEELFPLFKSDRELSKEEVRKISDFEEKLLDAENAENIDLAIAYLLSDRLLRDAMGKDGVLPKLRRMDMQISVCYTMMNMTERLTEYPQIAGHYRRKGLDIGQIFLMLREKEEFAKIESEEARELVLTNARFLTVFFEGITGDREENEKSLEMLRASLKIADDPFYTEAMPDYDWKYYRYRVLFYFAQETDFCNYRGHQASDFPEICERTEELWALWHTDPEYFAELDKESWIEFLLLKNRYYAGKISREDYGKGLQRLYHNRDKTLYDVCGIVENVQLPVEMLDLIWKERFSEADKAHFSYLLNNILAYIFHMPNSGALTFMLELIMHIITHFTELPEGMNFESLMLDLLAAMHPPTYVHSRMVAQFAVCLCGHLIDSSPELLIGTEGCETAEEVVQNRNAILNYTWHAALCHDAGKLFIIDTVFVYGRKLLDMEFDLIKTHPKMGATLLRRFPSTAKYAEVALGHHKWYDDSRGYPEDFDSRSSPVKTVIDLVQCSDCLDAATDTVGRSYNRGKSFDDLYKEICDGSGTRYAPWLPALLSRDEVREDIEFLLAEGRDKNYYDTYQLLKSVHEKEVQ